MVNSFSIETIHDVVSSLRNDNFLYNINFTYKEIVQIQFTIKKHNDACYEVRRRKYEVNYGSHEEKDIDYPLLNFCSNDLVEYIFKVLHTGYTYKFMYYAYKRTKLQRLLKKRNQSEDDAEKDFYDTCFVESSATPIEERISLLHLLNINVELA